VIAIKFKIILTFILLSTAPSLISAQRNMDGSMPQYLYPDFSKSVLLMKTGEKRTSVMNFNTVSEKLVFISDGKYFDLMNPEILDTVYLNDCKFVPVGKVFYEVVLGDPIALYIQHKGDLMEAGAPVGYGGTSQLAYSTYITCIDAVGGIFNLELPPNFVVKPAPVLWIRKDGEMLSFTTEKQYLKHFPDKAGQIKSYIKKNRLKIDKKEQLIRIVKYSGSL